MLKTTPPKTSNIIIVSGKLPKYRLVDAIPMNLIFHYGIDLFVANYSGTVSDIFNGSIFAGYGGGI
jgi:hypothetical protein